MNKNEQILKDYNILENEEEFNSASYRLRSVYTNLLSQSDFDCTADARDFSNINEESIWFCKAYEMSSSYKRGFEAKCTYSSLKKIQIKEKIELEPVFDAATPETAVAVLLSSLRNEGINAELVSQTIKYSKSGKKAIILVAILITDADTWTIPMELRVNCYKTGEM